MALLLSLLAACGGNAPAPAAPVPPDSAWVKGVQPWYCGAEILEAKETADGARTARSRDMAMKLRPTDDSLSGLYALQNAGESYIGTLTRFTPTGDRTGTLQWENDAKQKGVATLAFSPDFQTLTVTWQVGAETTSGASTLRAAPEAAGCVAAPLIR